MNRVIKGLLSVLLAASVTACSGQQGQRSTPSGTTSKTVTSSVTTTGTKGTMKFNRVTQTLGKWKVTVMSLAAKPSKPVTSTSAAVPARVSTVVRVQNTDTKALKMYRSDWTLVKDSGGTIKPVSKGQTSVTVQPGKHKTMALVFKVPTTTGVAYMLRFEPKQGGPGAIEVAVP